MGYVFEMLTQGWRYLHHDPYLQDLTTTTVRLALWSALIASVVGFPAACAIGLGKARVSRSSLILANAGLGLPPVAIGVFGFLLLPNGPGFWGGPWTGTMKGIVLAQTILSLPVIIALGAVAIRRLPAGLLDQASAYGAVGWRLGAFALREAKVGAITAVIVALGTAMAEVGAVSLIGGTHNPKTATLAVAILNDVAGAAGVAAAVGHLMVLVALMLGLGLILTIVQQWDAVSTWWQERRARAVVTLEGTA